MGFFPFFENQLPKLSILNLSAADFYVAKTKYFWHWMMESQIHLKVCLCRFEVGQSNDSKDWNWPIYTKPA